ncbi:MAG: hypothetical protein KIS77_08860 [Saprospiraceae bacterium]|nr:hypothetical protein [Saprospiraceae bacterium]
MPENKQTFTLKRIGLIALMTALIGIGAYVTAHEFNDGVITPAVIGSVFLGMAFPNLLIAGMMRLFRVHVGKIFLLIAAVCIIVGIVLISV